MHFQDFQNKPCIFFESVAKHQAQVIMNTNPQNVQRPSMATSGNALKQRQLVR